MAECTGCGQPMNPIQVAFSGGREKCGGCVVDEAEAMTPRGE